MNAALLKWCWLFRCLEWTENGYISDDVDFTFYIYNPIGLTDTPARQNIMIKLTNFMANANGTYSFMNFLLEFWKIKFFLNWLQWFALITNKNCIVFYWIDVFKCKLKFCFGWIKTNRFLWKIFHLTNVQCKAMLNVDKFR